MTRNKLKILAMISMVLDHTTKYLFTEELLASFLETTFGDIVIILMLMLGRIAFIIFAWCVAEGCKKTRNFKKYLLRLFVFALISEIPYQLIHYDKLSIGFHNVIFTLLLAALAIYAMQFMELRHINEYIANIVPSIIAICMAWLLDTDYDVWGVALILALYFVQNKKGRLWVIFVWDSVFYLGWYTISNPANLGTNYVLWIGSLIPILLFSLYNGGKGRENKWFFYIFYPAHFLAIYGFNFLI